MATYSTNADLILDNGKALDEFMASGMTASQRAKFFNAAREKAFNIINAHDMLRNKTKIPATHIDLLKQIEIDMVIGLVLASAYTQETTNISEWPQTYSARAKELLDSINYGSTAEDAEAQAGNVGNGTVEVWTNDLFTLTELWTLNAENANSFSVYGTVSGLLPSANVGVRYPEQNWVYGPEDYGLKTYGSRLHYAEFPIELLVTAGAIPFEPDDKFLIKTWCSSDHPSIKGLSVGKLRRA
jgi:hypothetical protein